MSTTCSLAEITPPLSGVAGPQLKLDLGQISCNPTSASIIVDQAGVLQAGNELGGLLMDDGPSADALCRFALVVDSDADERRLQVSLAGPPSRSFLFNAWPVVLPDDRQGVWLIGVETSIKDQLVDALSKSRSMFKDLAEISGDFCWQVSGDGIFRYVSPTGALGFDAWDLNGQAPGILGPRAAEAFAPQQLLRGHELWLADKNGTQRCLSISAMPMIVDGKWQGARGVARDVTELRLAESRLEAARQYEALLQSILEAINASILPEDILASAARAVRRGLGADSCTLMRPSGALTDGSAAAQAISADCFVGTVQVGTITISRMNGWSDADQSLLGRIAGHVAMAIAQANHLEDLERLSLTDALTGLRNRRAFEAELAGRLARVNRAGGCGCLLLVDVDHFKALNDGYGHQAGDQALKDIAAAVQICVRNTDIVARLGGDEFAIWLEDSDVLGADRVATILRSRVSLIAANWPLVKLGLSIGIASTRTGHSEFADLYERADAALYQVKRNGRDGAAIWGQEE